MKRDLIIAMVVFASSIPFAAQAAVATSHNWSGYVVRKNTVTSVSGMWDVPFVRASEGGDAAWIGIGGADGSANLIQTGICSIVRNGTIVYEAWYELVPAQSVTIPLALHAGDLVSGSVRESANGAWRISVIDVTTGASFSTLVQYHSAKNSAEWITERPSGNSVADDPFRFTVFMQLALALDGRTLSPVAAGARKLSLIDPWGDVVLAPSTLMGNGRSFYVLPSPGSALAAR